MGKFRYSRCEKVCDRNYVFTQNRIRAASGKHETIATRLHLSVSTIDGLRKNLMAWHAYLFEASSIQSYIFQTSRLKEIIGASELIASLTDTLLPTTLNALGISNQIRFSRCAGGAFYAFSEDQQAIERLYAVWTLLLQQYAPGLPYDYALAIDKKNEADALSDAEPAKLVSRNRQRVALPQAGPLTQRCARTGQAATRFSYVKQEAGADPIDDATDRKLRFARHSTLTDRFTHDATVEPDHWPVNLDPEPESEDDTAKPARLFPFAGDNRNLAIVHADGNGIGQLLIDLKEAVSDSSFVDTFRQFSEVLSDATEAAVRRATDQVLLPLRTPDNPMIPARPIVLGGDDLTLILRSDCALDFVLCYLEAFERETEQRFSKLDLPIEIGGLTACAGIAFVRANQPFYMGAELAEGLTGHAKTASKAIAGRKLPPSSIAFHRVISTVIDDYGTLLDQERTFMLDNKQRYRDTLEVYGLQPDDEALPFIGDLQTLTRLIQAKQVSNGPTRELLGMLARDGAQARQIYRRWRQRMEDPKHRGYQSYLDLMECMERLSPSFEREADLPFSRAILPGSTDDVLRSPLGDAVILKAMGAVANVASGKEAAA